MAAPLAPDFAESVLWQEQAPAHDEPGAEPQRPAARRDLPDRADVIVVGAGYAGVSAARELAAAGRDVLVLDAHPVGWGASTRNGGMVIPELKAGPAALERSLGPLGRRLYAEVNEAFDHVEELTAGSAPLIACDYQRTGQLYLAHAARLVPALQAMAREHGELGEAVRFVPRAELGAEVGSLAYHGGVVFERTGGLHPARFHRGLVARARDAGARIVGGDARALDRPPGRQWGGAPRDRPSSATAPPTRSRPPRSSCARTPTPTTPCRSSPGGCCRSAASSSPPRCWTPSWPTR